MKAWGRLEVGTVITISTAHIPEKELKFLEDCWNDRELYDSNHWINRFQWANFDYGYMIGGNGLQTFLEEDDDVEAMPQFIREVAELAKK